MRRFYVQLKTIHVSISILSLVYWTLNTEHLCTAHKAYINCGCFMFRFIVILASVRNSHLRLYISGTYYICEPKREPHKCIRKYNNNSAIYNSKQHFMIFAHLNWGTHFSEYATKTKTKTKCEIFNFSSNSIHPTFHEWSNRNWKQQQQQKKRSSSSLAVQTQTKQMNSNECRQTNKLNKPNLCLRLSMCSVITVHAIMGTIS